MTVIDFPELLRMAFRFRGASEDEASLITAQIIRLMDPGKRDEFLASIPPGVIFALAKALHAGGKDADSAADAIIGGLFEQITSHYRITDEELLQALRRFQGN